MCARGLGILPVCLGPWSGLLYDMCYDNVAQVRKGQGAFFVVLRPVMMLACGKHDTRNVNAFGRVAHHCGRVCCYRQTLWSHTCVGPGVVGVPAEAIRARGFNARDLRAAGGTIHQLSGDRRLWPDAEVRSWGRIISFF
jgi:hypothetical protein